MLLTRIKKLYKTATIHEALTTLKRGCTARSIDQRNNERNLFLQSRYKKVCNEIKFEMGEGRVNGQEEDVVSSMVGSRLCVNLLRRSSVEDMMGLIGNHPMAEISKSIASK